MKQRGNSFSANTDFFIQRTTTRELRDVRDVDSNGSEVIIRFRSRHPLTDMKRSH